MQDDVPNKKWQKVFELSICHPECIDIQNAYPTYLSNILIPRRPYLFIFVWEVTKVKKTTKQTNLLFQYPRGILENNHSLIIIQYFYYIVYVHITTEECSRDRIKITESVLSWSSQFMHSSHLLTFLWKFSVLSVLITSWYFSGINVLPIYILPKW